MLGFTFTNRERNLRGEEKENFIRKRALTSRDDRNIKENIIINQAQKNEKFLAEPLIVLPGKTTISVGHVKKYVIMQANAKIIRTTSLLKLWVL